MVEENNAENEGVRFRIAVVDDEFRDFRFGDLPNELREILEDKTSPEFESSIEYAVRKGHVRLNDLDLDGQAEEIKARWFVNEVLLTEDFFNGTSKELRVLLRRFWDERAQMQALKSAIYTAFPDTKFDIVPWTTRPDAQDLLDYDLLILDLIMGADHDPVRAVEDYLHQLSGAAGKVKKLPPIILCSFQYERLKEHRLAFRSAGKVSAAGLYLLAKSKLTAAGGAGLLLDLWNRMNREQETANKIRLFGLALDDAFRSATDKASETFWNLDAGSLQEIHLTATNDNDPYEEHLHELLAREYAWHLENDEAVRKRIGDLSKRFDKDIELNQTGSQARIKYRYGVHNGADMNTMQGLISHYNWMISKHIPPFNDFHPVADSTRFNRFLPFGSVLIPANFGDNKIALINLTQQCDLNKRNSYKNNISLIFAQAHVYESGTEPVVPNFIRELWVDDKYYDLQIDLGKHLAIPITKVSRYLKGGRYSVKGRLRAEIARQMLQVVTNNATRLAAFTFSSARLYEAKVCLRIGGETTREFWFDSAEHADNANDAIVVVAQKLGSNGKVLHFLDDNGFAIGQWIKWHLSRHDLLELMPREGDISDLLRLGLSGSKIGDLSYICQDCDFNAVDRVLENPAARKKGAALIVCVRKDAED